MLYSKYGGTIPSNLILEGAKFDLFLKNWMNEGQDYKGLKKDLQEIIDANNMSEDKLKSKGTGLMHTCKRIMQTCTDLQTTLIPAVGTVGAISSASKLAASLGLAGIPISMIPSVIIGGIISLVVTFISNRIFRYMVDTVEFHTIKNDAKLIVKELRNNAKNTSDKELAKKLNAEADKLEASIKKYSNKSDK